MITVTTEHPNQGEVTLSFKANLFEGARVFNGYLTVFISGEISEINIASYKGVKNILEKLRQAIVIVCMDDAIVNLDLYLEEKK